jgi:hypothetical protein
MTGLLPINSDKSVTCPHQFQIDDPGICIPKNVKPLFDQFMRDTFCMLGPDGWYYLTGTTPAKGRSQPIIGDWNDGIEMWKSKDLKKWEPMGLVYSLDHDGTWQKPFVEVEPGLKSFEGAVLDGKRRVVWAPELHYIKSKKTWLIATCMGNQKDPRRGNFILQSKSGKPEGPYENISACKDGPIDTRIDGSLFEDDDGSVYFLSMNRFLSRMKDDLSGLDEEPREFIETRWPEDYYSEGAFLFKRKGRYHLVQTYFSKKTKNGELEYSPLKKEEKNLDPALVDATSYGYDAVISSADQIYGPYGPRRPLLIGGGHNNVFQDSEGGWWCTAFADPRGAIHEIYPNDGKNPYISRPMLIPMKWESEKLIVDSKRVI